ncbi:hypothetical protein QE152_g23031 [Popillia japonica]|uniref:Uncharacterized protein n=1 Tax=Popillia japonica TaxID=7064 RepID=A0AAW1KIE2_POPJA
MSTLSQSSKEDRSISEGSPKKDKKKKKGKGFRTPSFLKKNKRIALYRKDRLRRTKRRKKEKDLEHHRF